MVIVCSMFIMLEYNLGNNTKRYIIKIYNKYHLILCNLQLHEDTYTINHKQFMYIVIIFDLKTGLRSIAIFQ